MAEKISVTFTGIPIELTVLVALRPSGIMGILTTTLGASFERCFASLTIAVVVGADDLGADRAVHLLADRDDHLLEVARLLGDEGGVRGHAVDQPHLVVLPYRSQVGGVEVELQRSRVTCRFFYLSDSSVVRQARAHRSEKMRSLSAQGHPARLEPGHRRHQVAEDGQEDGR